MTASPSGPPPGSLGGFATVRKHGVSHMRRIASEGGHTTVSRYGVAYMAQIGSAGAARRLARLAEKELTNMDLQFLVPGNPGPDSVDYTPTGKQEIIEHLLNRSLITETEARQMAELSLEEVQADYGRITGTIDSGYDLNSSCCECGKTMYSQPELKRGWCDDHLPQPETLDEVEEDDDPQCGACGVYRSEHTLCGCSDGFITADAWQREREAIREQAYRAVDEHLDDYGDYDDYSPY